MSLRRFLCGALLLANGVSSITLNLDDDASIKAAAKTIAHGAWDYYPGYKPGQTPGKLVDGYYWWECGAMFGSLIDYWHYTGDSTYNANITQGMLWQASPKRNYEPVNETSSLGNDDQAFWGMSAMMAAEVDFPNPPSDQPSWIELAEGVFLAQTSRWDTTKCGGGLFWQINTLNVGYSYKNSISQGGLFNIAARIGAYTQNSTYFEWVDKVWSWMDDVHLIGPNYEIFDGTESDINCANVSSVQWSYNSAIFLHGSAVMWNQTTGATQQVWHDRVQGILSHLLATFFQNGVMIEIQCERNTPNTKNYCNTDQLSFKAYVARWLTATTKLCPWTADQILPYIRSSSIAAAQTCVGGSDGVTCGNRWWQQGWDGLYGAGEQMSALEVIQSNLAKNVKGPLNINDGGTSTGTAKPDGPRQITTSDKAGAGILTAIALFLTLLTAWWILIAPDHFPEPKENNTTPRESAIAEEKEGRNFFPMAAVSNKFSSVSSKFSDASKKLPGMLTKSR